MGLLGREGMDVAGSLMVVGTADRHIQVRCGACVLPVELADEGGADLQPEQPDRGVQDDGVSSAMADPSGAFRDRKSVV